MSRAKSKHWRWTDRIRFGVCIVYFFIYGFWQLGTLLFKCWASMKFDLSKTCAILNSDDRSGAPEPFHLFNLIGSPRDHYEFKSEKYRKLAEKFTGPLSENDALLPALMKLENARPSRRELPITFQTGFKLKFLLRLTIINVEVREWDDLDYLEMLLISGYTPCKPVDLRNLSAEQIRLIKTFAKKEDQWIENVDQNIQAGMVEKIIHYLGSVTDIEKKGELIAEVIGLCHTRRIHVSFTGESANEAVIDTLLEEGLDGELVDYTFNSNAIRATDLNLRVLKKSDIEKQAQHLKKKDFFDYSEEDQLEYRQFIAERPKLFEKLSWRASSIDRSMVEHYMRSGATRKPVFHHYESFWDMLPVLVQECPEVSLRLIACWGSPSRLGFDDRTKLEIHRLAAEMDILPENITRLSTLKLIERARMKGCFYSLAQLKRLDVNDVLEAAITVDQFSFIRKNLQAGSGDADLEKYPESILEDILMDELGL